jgi:ATP-dependent DNA helicase RecQ
VLVGNQNEKALKFGHEKLAVFGAGADHKREEWQALIRQLAAAEFVSIDATGYGNLVIAAKGRALLRCEGTFSHRPPRANRKAERKARASMRTLEEMPGKRPSVFAKIPRQPAADRAH